MNPWSGPLPGLAAAMSGRDTSAVTVLARVPSTKICTEIGSTVLGSMDHPENATEPLDAVTDSSAPRGLLFTRKDWQVNRRSAP